MAVAVVVVARLFSACGSVCLSREREERARDSPPSYVVGSRSRKPDVLKSGDSK